MVSVAACSEKRRKGRNVKGRGPRREAYSRVMLARPKEASEKLVELLFIGVFTVTFPSHGWSKCLIVATVLP